MTPSSSAKPARSRSVRNSQITDLINSVKGYKSQIADRAQAVNQVDAMESLAHTNPANVQNLVTLGSAYIQMQQNARAGELFDIALGRPELNFAEAAGVLQSRGPDGRPCPAGKRCQESRQPGAQSSHCPRPRGCRRRRCRVAGH